MSYFLSKISTKEFHWQLAFISVASAALVYVGIALEKQLNQYFPESRVFPSTFNNKPSGTSGLLQLTKRVGLRASVWQLPYRRLHEIKGVLVLFQPEESLPAFEIDQILNWVRQGNDLIYFDHFHFNFERLLLEKLGLKAFEGKELKDTLVKSEKQKGYFTHVLGLIISTDCRLKGGRPLIADSSGSIICETTYGNGRILVGVSPSLCANRRLDNQSNWTNFQFFINWLRTTDGEIFFDEKCHGFLRATNVFAFLAREPLGMVFLQLILLAVVALVSHNQRFGAIEPPKVICRASNLEFIDGLANTYQRAKAIGLIVEIVTFDLKRKLSRYLGISPHESPEKFAEVWPGHNREEIKNLFSRTERALAGEMLSEEELIGLFKSCDKISEQLKALLLP